MDDFFNHDIAEWISKSISRMDDDEAEMFTRFFVYEVHKQDIENNRRTLDRHVEDVQKSILADLTPEIRELVTKAWDGPETPWEELYGKQQPRDRSTGRWSKVGFSGPSVTYERQRGPKKGQKVDITTSLNSAGGVGTTFADRWTASGPNDHSTNERTYRRVRAGAELLEHVPDKRVKAAAQAGQYVGQFGPEAEKVVGPAARRTAYRYRGTERMPDKQLLTYRDQALTTTAKRTFKDADFNSARPPQLSPEQKMSASEDAAVGYLYKRLPSKKLSTLHRESGKLPPSEGVIINRDGDIVTQAVGYNEDHYLPFNLKNLKGLQGGSYVRTRSTGGLTSEDIYTGLVAGARSITVVSRSGVFTLDFEDDLRGGRRYSDKARQMVGRYAQTLDAVQSEKVARQKLTPDERAEVREEVEEELGDMGYTTTQIETKIREREEEYSRTPQLTKSEVDAINLQAMEAVQSGKGPRGEGSERFVPKDPKKAFNYYRSEFMDAALEDKQNRMYRLDAEGYEAAMQALEEQFPYFVARTEVKKLPRGTEKDSGYVRPNYIRPKDVRAGYFDEEINGKGKFSASELHYQNYGRRSGERAGVGNEGEAETKAATPRKLNLNESRANVRTQKEREAAITEAVTQAAAIAAGVENGDVNYKLLTKHRREFNFSSVSAADIDTLMDEVESISALVGSPAGRAAYPGAAEKLNEHLATYRRKDKELKSRTPFDQEKWNPERVEDVPQMFADRPEHHPGSPPEVYERALNKVFARRELSGKIAPEMTDKQLMAEEKKYSDLYAAAVAVKNNPNDGAATNKLENALIRADKPDGGIQRLFAEIDDGNLETVEMLIQEEKKRVMGIKEARSIMAAAGGSLPSKPSGPPTIKGEVVRSSSFNINNLKDFLASGPNLPSDAKTKLDRRAQEWEHGDEKGIMEAANALPKEFGTLAESVIEELNKRDD